MNATGLTVLAVDDERPPLEDLPPQFADDENEIVLVFKRKDCVDQIMEACFRGEKPIVCGVLLL